MYSLGYKSPDYYTATEQCTIHIFSQKVTPPPKKKRKPKTKSKTLTKAFLSFVRFPQL